MELLGEYLGGCLQVNGGVSDRVRRCRKPGERRAGGEGYFTKLIVLAEVDRRDTRVDVDGMSAQMGL